MEHDALYKKRHSLAHLLAMAVREIDPGAEFGTGPVTEHGFHYDILPSTGVTFSDQDFARLEKSMRALIKRKLPFIRKEVSPDEARALFVQQKLKLELIDDIVARGEPLTAYQTGDFTDLCAGGHVEHTGEIDPKSFKLEHLSGVYWKGEASNPQLVRIAGLAFDTAEELAAFEEKREEARARDHRKLGKELGLFVFSDLVGPGLPLFTPRGTLVRELLDQYVWELRRARGFQKVTIPHITKKALYETSGHWTKFSDELFRVSTREGHEYALKPMNCPHHAQIYASAPHSYRDLPVRYCETTTVYRDEQSGELSGLARVLAITQDDAHVFCRESQVTDEAFAIWDMIDTLYTGFGYKNLQVRFSRHDPEHFEKYLGTRETWQKAEDALRSLIRKRGVEYADGPGEAALYGPKIDFIAEDSLGRKLQVATIQLDFNQPANFGLVCVNETGEKEPVVMIHCAILGSLERFMASLLEHTAGRLPLWLSPIQIALLPIGEEQATYAEAVRRTLETAGLRVEIRADESLGKRIRQGKLEKIPYLAVIGGKEAESKTVSLESRDQGPEGQLTLDDLIRKLEEEIRSKK